jgi:hypothetical protein
MKTCATHWKNLLIALFALVAVWALVSPSIIRSQTEEGNTEDPALNDLLARLEALEERFDAELAAIRQAWQESGEPSEVLVSSVEAWRDEGAEDIAELNALAAEVDASGGDGRDPGRDLVGFANAAGGSSFAVGFNNQVEGANAAAVGHGLIVRGDNALAAGAFNKADGDSAGAIFSIGIGTDGARETALEVRPDGSVVLGRPQGGIPMYSAQ